MTAFLLASLISAFFAFVLIVIGFIGLDEGNSNTSCLIMGFGNALASLSIGLSPRWDIDFSFLRILSSLGLLIALVIMIGFSIYETTYTNSKIDKRILAMHFIFPAMGVLIFLILVFGGSI